MASGKVHDQTTWMGAIGFGLGLYSATQNLNQSLCFTAGVVFGGLLFSPDLDLKSKPWRRWGLLRWIWTPYQKMVPHRSILSHSPILGTAIKLLYLGVPIAIACLVMGVAIDLAAIEKVLNAGGYAFLLGVEVGCCIHLFMDWVSSKR